MSDRQSAIDRVNGLLHLIGNGTEVSGVTNLEVVEAPFPLRVRKVIDVTLPAEFLGRSALGKAVARSFNYLGFC